MSENRQDFHKPFVRSIFSCKLCEYRLDYPIINVEGLGTICGSCYGKGVYTHARPNLELEEDMSKLCFPCRYQNRGCIFEATFISTCYHEKNCNFRQRMCPLVYETKCDCLAISDLIKHFENDHKDRVIVSEDYSFTIEKPIVDKRDMFYLIAIGLRYYILQIKFDVDKQTFFYVFYYFGIDNDPNTFTLLIENKDFILTSKAVKAWHESNLSSSVNTNKTIKNHHIISEIQLTLQNKIVFSVNYEGSNLKQYVKSFECPICFYYMTDEILICSTGHSICQKCSKKLDKCPTCKSPFTGRNYSMESVVKLFKLPCKNSDFCNKYIEGSNYKFHATNCFYNTYACPFAKTKGSCTWKGLYNALITHLQSDHEKLVHSNRNNSLIVPVYSDKKYTCCFIVEAYVIICLCTITDDFMLSLELHPVLTPYDDQIVCKINVSNQFPLRTCILQFSLPYYERNVVNVTSYISFDGIKMEFSFKRIRDPLNDK